MEESYDPYLICILTPLKGLPQRYLLQEISCLLILLFMDFKYLFKYIKKRYCFNACGYIAISNIITWLFQRKVK